MSEQQVVLVLPHYCTFILEVYFSNKLHPTYEHKLQAFVVILCLERSTQQDPSEPSEILYNRLQGSNPIPHIQRKGTAILPS